jgi:tRNA pseudouridine38-40 synthase
MKKNYKLTIRYDGGRYLGWQHQPGKDMEHTIQGKLELVLSRMLEEERAGAGTAGGAAPEHRKTVPPHDGEDASVEVIGAAERMPGSTRGHDGQCFSGYGQNGTGDLYLSQSLSAG